MRRGGQGVRELDGRAPVARIPQASHDCLQERLEVSHARNAIVVASGFRGQPLADLRTRLLAPAPTTVARSSGLARGFHQELSDIILERCRQVEQPLDDERRLAPLDSGDLVVADTALQGKATPG